MTDWWDAYALATNLNGYRITILTLEQFTKCCVSAGLVGVGVLLSKTSRRGHKSAKFAVAAAFPALNRTGEGSSPSDLNRTIRNKNASMM